MRAMNEEKLQKLAEYIKQYARENNGESPRLADIMEYMNMAKSSAYRYVLELEKPIILVGKVSENLCCKEFCVIHKLKAECGIGLSVEIPHIGKL